MLDTVNHDAWPHSVASGTLIGRDWATGQRLERVHPVFPRLGERLAASHTDWPEPDQSH